MPRSVVCLGVPVDLEERTYTLQNGDRAGEEQTSLSFHLLHDLTAVSGSVQFETANERVIEQIKKASDERQAVTVVASGQAVRSEKTNDYGRPRDWVKLKALAVVL